MDRAFGDISRADIASYLWEEGDLRSKLWPQQLQIYDKIRSGTLTGTEIVLLCARQFGKSHLGVILALEDAIRMPDCCIIIIGPTIKQTKEIVNPRMRKIIRDAPQGMIRQSKSDNKWIVYHPREDGEGWDDNNFSEIVIGGFDQSASAQRGKTVKNIYVEEIVDSKPDDYLDVMRSDLGPALTHSKGGKMIFLTTLPKIPDHPFITDTMVKAELREALFKFTIYDNKQLTQQDFDDCVERCGGKHTIEFQREYECKIVRDPTKVVVPDFDEGIHVKDPIMLPPKFNAFTTIDWGGVRDKTVALLHYYDFLNDTDVFWDERVFDANTPSSVIVYGGSPDFLASKSLELVTPDSVMGMELMWGWPVTRYGDVPGQLSVDLNLDHAFNVLTPVKDDWRAGINLMNMRFSTGKVLVHKRCTFLRTTLRSGMFNKQKTDFDRTEALGHCDALAACMYAIRSCSRESPYGGQMPRSDFYNNQFVRPADPHPEASVMQPKTFGNVGIKRFGVFKK